MQRYRVTHLHPSPDRFRFLPPALLFSIFLFFVLFLLFLLLLFLLLFFLLPLFLLTFSLVSSSTFLSVLPLFHSLVSSFQLIGVHIEESNLFVLGGLLCRLAVMLSFLQLLCSRQHPDHQWPCFCTFVFQFGSCA